LCSQVNAYISKSIYQGETLSRCIRDDSLEGGILVEQTDKILLLPSGTIHAVRTIQGAIFLGWETTVLESLVAMARFIRIQLRYYETSQEMLEQDIRKYTDAIIMAHRLRRSDSTLLALESWLDVIPALTKTLERVPRSRLVSWTAKLFKAWDSWTYQAPDIDICPCKVQYADGIGEHVRREHLIQLSSHYK
jgi:hypothetical protein